MQQSPLVTIALITYNNVRYLNEAIDAVFSQDYPRIELIISNDCSDDFIESEVFDYASQNRTPNIERIVINKNESNCGTVKHANKVLSIASGELFMLIAGDDALNGVTVISKIVERFNDIGSTALVVTSQCAMYDEHLQDIHEMFLSEERIQLIESCTPAELFPRIAEGCIIAAPATCYRKSILERIGGFDEGYFLIEDVPLFAKLTRMGVQTFYLDIVSVRHRDGGVSHGNKRNSDVVLKHYWKDEMRYCKEELLKYRHLLTKNGYSRIKRRYDELYAMYFIKFEWPNMTGAQKIMHSLRSSHVILYKIIKKAFRICMNVSRDARIVKGTFGLSAVALMLMLLFRMNDMESFIGVMKTQIVMQLLAYTSFTTVLVGIFLVGLRVIGTVFEKGIRKMASILGRS